MTTNSADLVAWAQNVKQRQDQIKAAIEQGRGFDAETSNAVAALLFVLSQAPESPPERTERPDRPVPAPVSLLILPAGKRRTAAPTAVQKVSG